MNGTTALLMKDPGGVGCVGRVESCGVIAFPLSISIIFVFRLRVIGKKEWSVVVATAYGED